MTGPRCLTVEHDGLRIAALDWGGHGPPLLLQHPNGFCAGFFDPVARALRHEFRPIGVDVRGHGASDRPVEPAACTFPAVAGDVLAVLDTLGIEEVVVLGHSMGGAVAVLLDEMRPGIVRKAMLCEAIAFPPGAMTGRGSGGANPMADVARERRAVWPDRATVLESYASRPPMDVLDPAALAAYVQYGFRDRPDGRVELACAPEIEARCFEAAAEADGAARAFRHLARFTGDVVVVHGSRSNLPREVFSAQAEAAGGLRLEVAGTHFFPQEDTGRTVALVHEHLTV